MASCCDKPNIQEFVRDYYGKQLHQSADLKTNACCAVGAPPAWIAATLSQIHDDVMSRFYGCGFPIPHAVQGAKVLDLGCGTGRDVYALSQLVGADGFVHGLDMTDEQLATARDTMDWHMKRFGYAKTNVAFHQGFIEDLSPLPIENGSLDIVVSNCVVNLSPRKDLVLAEAARVLKNGGEFYFSDVFCDRRLPKDIASDPLLFAECLGGALYEADFVQMAKQAGFLEPRVVERAPITIQNDELEQRVGTAKFTSVTYRLFKIPGLDAQCEDYGQAAVYKGGIPGAPVVFWLDNKHAFEVGRIESVCKNTARMLSESRFAKYFEILGDGQTHFGAFDCSATNAALQYGAASSSASNNSSCTTTGSCC